MIKAKKKSMPTIRHIPDDLWEEFELVLPPEKPARTVGRPAVSFRKVLNGILYVLRTGCQWKKVPKEFGSGSIPGKDPELKDGENKTFFFATSLPLDSDVIKKLLDIKEIQLTG